MGDEKLRPPSKKIEVVLRNLDSLLRKDLGNSLVVDSFTTSNLVSVGENYGSTMLKVDAEVRRDGPNSKPEKLFLVAKMTPPTEFQKMMFDSPVTFPKEIYMFTNIVPAYKALEREYGISEAEVFDSLPKLYGSRLSLEAGEDNFDHDAVILMENLKVKNYASGNRRIGADLKHARALIEVLARFHALGIALKFKKPDLFEAIKHRAASIVFKEDLIPDPREQLLKEVKSIPVLIPYLSRIEPAFKGEITDLWLKPPTEPWASIVHTDLWLNNIMFRDDESGNPEDIKFVDFQNYLYQNPMRDVIFFIFSSCIKEVRVSHVDELIDLYYEKLITHLTRLQCDVTLYSRESFDEQLIDAAKIELLHCIMMARVVLVDTEADPSAANPEELFEKRSNSECLERTSEIILKFIEQNWI